MMDILAPRENYEDIWEYTNSLEYRRKLAIAGEIHYYKKVRIILNDVIDLLHESDTLDIEHTLNAIVDPISLEWELAYDLIVNVIPLKDQKGKSVYPYSVVEAIGAVSFARTKLDNRIFNRTKIIDEYFNPMKILGDPRV